MIRFVLALTLAGALIAPPAYAQTPETEDNHYQFNRVEDGYLRLISRPGRSRCAAAARSGGPARRFPTTARRMMARSPACRPRTPRSRRRCSTAACRCRAG